MFVTGRRPSLIPVGVIAASAVLLGCGGESDTVQIHTEIESGDIFTVGVFTADGAGFCPTGTALPSRFEPVEETDGRQTFSQNQYECDDGSGTFFIETILDLPYEFEFNAIPPEGIVGSDIAWSLEPGLGDYADRSGSGEVTVEIDNGFFVFDGTLSID